ncbi:28S ribosomal protein S5, mitochondrial [Steccherinum ochraceum]|uniref:Small ribosomal subunit protein uS5m n=1 Tax=Steccherinum ochraceum TaxID=92696 RepID=A0A4R0RSH2_9APHY|nr:28S ribosomal protein S5, mitochondrial [Steccherinum ochraceum]
MLKLSRSLAGKRVLTTRPCIRFASSSSAKSPQNTTAPTVEIPQGVRTVSPEEASQRFDLKNPAFPNLLTPDPLMDLHDSKVFPPERGRPYASKVVVRNDPSMFNAYHDVAALEGVARDELGSDAEGEEDVASRYLSADEIRDLHVYPLLTRYVTQQTGKGKVSRTAYLVVVGNGNGLVGFGEAKGHDRTEVMKKAKENAVRNMDLVERFEGRTLWTEMEAKLGATKIILRPRPVGFGLAVNPYIHQVFKAAGIKDASAKVWGSRNPYQVIRLLTQMLHPGAAPVMMGNGIGGSGRRLESGRGLRGKEDIQRERGRKLVNAYTR